MSNITLVQHASENGTYIVNKFLEERHLTIAWTQITERKHLCTLKGAYKNVVSRERTLAVTCCRALKAPHKQRNCCELIYLRVSRLYKVWAIPAYFLEILYR